MMSSLLSILGQQIAGRRGATYYGLWVHSGGRLGVLGAPWGHLGISWDGLGTALGLYLDGLALLVGRSAGWLRLGCWFLV